MTVHITLYGDAAEQFEEYRDRVEDVRGHSVGNAEFCRLLLAEFEPPVEEWPRG